MKWADLVTLFVLALIFALLIKGAIAYTPPEHDAVALVFNNSYTPPTSSEVDLVLGNGTVTPPVNVTCTISVDTTITSDLDCSGETFLIINNSDVVVNSGSTVTCLIEAIEDGSSLANAGTILRGAS